MRGPASRVLGCLLSLGLGACTHGAPPPQVSPPPAPSPERLSKQLEASLAALSLPDDLVLAARWKDPNALLQQLESWSGAPVAIDGWLRTRIGDPSLSLDLSAPVELIAVLDRAPAMGLSWALSFGLTTPVGAPVSPRDVESPLGLACAESKSLGAAPARMVCSASDDELARLLPHATRALPLAPIGEAPLSNSLRTSPLAKLDDQTLHTLASAWIASIIGSQHVNDRFDAQIAKVTEAVANDVRYLAQDLDGASIELSVSAEEHALDLSVLVPAAAGRSTLGQLAVGSGASGLAPEEFWQAQEASEEAGFSWAWQPTPFARMREPLAGLLGTILDYRGVPNRLEQQARELVAYLPLPRGPVIHARGRLPPSPSAKLERAPWLEALGWQLYNVRGNPVEYRYYVDALARSFNDPILGPQFVRLIKSAFGPEWAPARMQQRRPTVAAGLPRDSFVLEVTFAHPQLAPLPDELGAEPGTAPAPAAPPSPTWFAVFVPDEDGVRIAAGADERFLVSLLAQHGRTKQSATLAGRPGLGALHEHRILAGGFVSLAALTDSGPGSLARWFVGDGASQRLASAPHRGASPIVYSLSQPNEAWLHLTLRLGHESLDDLLFLFGAQPARP